MSKNNKKRNVSKSNTPKNAPNKNITIKDSYYNYPARIGQGQPNLTSAGEYKNSKHITTDWNKLISLYRDNWIAKRIVDIIPSDMVKNWYKINSNLKLEEQSLIDKCERKTKLKSRILEGLRWGRLFGGAIGVILIEGDEDILEEPLNLDYVMPSTFKGLMIVDRWSGVNISVETIQDIHSNDMGLPEYYMVQSSAMDNPEKVHHSRVVRFVGRELPSWEKVAEQYWGASEIEHIYSELQKYNATSYNVSQLMFRANILTYKIDELSQVLSSTDPRAQQALYNTMSSISALLSNSGLMLIGQNDGLENHSYSFGGISDVLETFMYDISGAAEIPATKLFGRAPAGLNATGESDSQNYYDMIEGRQESDLRPIIEKLLPIICISELGYVPEDIEIEFNTVRRINDTERADYITKMTDAITNAFSAGGISQKTYLQELSASGKPYNSWTAITPDDIENADDSTVLFNETFSENLET